MIDDQLDPPGSIAVLGAGPLGVEAALYGRYLGYDVTVLEAERVGAGLLVEPHRPLPEPFERYRSPLGMAALVTQGIDHVMPGAETMLTAGQYVEAYLEPLAATDLLADRLELGRRAVRVEPAPEAVDEEESPAGESAAAEAEGAEADEPVPPDLLVFFDASDGPGQRRFEAVVDATGAEGEVARPAAGAVEAGEALDDLATGTPYLFQIGARSRPALSFLEGLEQIRRLFALLGGRESLDLYRTARF